MSKVLIFNVPAHGHTNPTLPLVRELVSRGETVIYYSFPEFQEKIKATGAHFRVYGNFPGVSDFTSLSKRMSRLYRSLLYATSEILDDVISTVKKEKPDYIIHDSICVWGKYAAAVCGVPALTSCTTFVFKPGSLKLKVILTELFRFNLFLDLQPILEGAHYHRFFAKKYGIRNESFVSTLCCLEPVNLVYTSRELQPEGAEYDHKIFRFVGPSISQRSGDTDTCDYGKMPKPLIYVSLGTVLNDNINFYNKCIRALAPISGHLVLSVGKTLDPLHLGELPDNVTVKSHVNQLVILAHADAFVSHGGMNSVHEALFNGVPLCLYPFHVEQESVADSVYHNGCGLILKTLHHREIRKKVERLLREPHFSAQCRRVSHGLKNAGGYKKAVDDIFMFKTENNIT